MVKAQTSSSQELQEFKRQSEESLQVLKGFGFELDMTKWLTIKRYGEKYGVSQQVVVNWIGRGVIPADSIKDIPELNNIRLVKDQSYK